MSEIRSCTWDGPMWDHSIVRGQVRYNRPLNREAVTFHLARKINQAIFNNFNGLETTIRFGGVSGRDTNEYWVVLPGVPTLKAEKLKADLMLFVQGYISCDKSY